MKAAIIYDSKSGTTEQYAQWLSLPLRLPALHSEETDWLQLSKYECLIIGAPVYNGRLLVRDWMHRHASSLRNKKVFLFIVSITPATEEEKRTQVLCDNVAAGVVSTGDIFWMPGKHPELEEPTVVSPFHLNPLFDAVRVWSAKAHVSRNH